MTDDALPNFELHQGDIYRAELLDGPLKGHLVRVESGGSQPDLSIEVPIPETFDSALYKWTGNGTWGNGSYRFSYEFYGRSANIGPRNE